MFSSYAAVVMRRPELDVNSNRNVKVKRGDSAAPPMSPQGKVLVYRPGSSRTSCVSPLGRDSAPWVGVATLGLETG